MATLCPGCEQARMLTRLLADDAIDAALDAGLMGWVQCPGECADPAYVEAITRAQVRLRTAWAARERYRQRAARLARRAAERDGCANSILIRPRNSSTARPSSCWSR
jgi:hypothetical protein